MGGQEGSRGYLYQGLVAILTSCIDDRWEKISVEYPTGNDKVDIALINSDNSVSKAIQVKSSINLFTKSNLVRWMEELIDDTDATEYALYIIGNCDRDANIFAKSVEKYYKNKLDEEAKKSLTGHKSLLQKNQIKIKILPFGQEYLQRVIRDSLHEFVDKLGYKIVFSELEQLCYTLVGFTSFLSTNGELIEKSNYEDKILKWLVVSSNDGIRKNTQSSELDVFAYVNGTLSKNFIAYNINMLPSYKKFNDKVISESEQLIKKISEIKLQPNIKVQEDMKSETDIYEGMPNIFASYPAELNAKEKENCINKIKEYLDVNVEKDFFYLGNLERSTVIDPFGSYYKCSGEEKEKEKNKLLNDLGHKLTIFETIKDFSEILKQVKVLPICIKNISEYTDNNITITIKSHTEDYEILDFDKYCSGDDREMMDFYADLLIEEEILEEILKIQEDGTVVKEDIVVEPLDLSFIRPDPFGRRARHDFGSLKILMTSYYAEESVKGFVRYEFKNLRPEEAKWLNPYLMILPKSNNFNLEYFVISDNLGKRLEGKIGVQIE